MIKVKQLPYLAIKAVGKTKEEQIDSLIKLEPILYFLGYNYPNEDWNNNRMDYYKQKFKQTLILSSNCFYGYHNHTCGVRVIFKADEVNEIIKHVLNNKL